MRKSTAEAMLRKSLTADQMQMQIVLRTRKQIQMQIVLRTRNQIITPLSVIHSDGELDRLGTVL